FDDYQITLNGTTHLLWKNGKVDAEATKAYNEAKLNGKLPKEEDAATQDAELLISILESLKNKKDPITGADISSVQVLSILSGLAFFDDYQITLNGTTHLLWKNGKVDAEATKAYNEAKLNGKLPKEENAATQDAELLISILESLKNKKDPITGADISSVQVLSILSGLAFSYRAGRYRGKKLRIPNPDKKKKKNKKSKMKVEISEEVLNHADVGDFTVNPSTGKVSKMKGGGHGQSNIDFLKENGLEVNIEKTYSNGVRTGNVPDHKIKAKRIGNNQSWFPENWTSKDIKSAGQHIASQSNYAIAKDGEVIFGEYNGVRVGVIKTDGEIGTIFPDATKQP
ncbi:EndoU domain-containing protein, partial [Listeria seeligeri]|uniref:EndoU domain-containing protein n=1 Tax=Listeria seeligeri TaxID=1640 RepID=UPI002023AAC9